MVDTIQQKGSPTIFGFPIFKYSRRTQLTLVICGIFLFFLSFFLLHEFVFSTEGFKYSGLQTLIMFFCSSCLGCIEYCITSKGARNGPILEHFKVALFSMLSVTLGAYSLLLLNFPTWVLFKSARVLFVMIGGVVILRKNYSQMQCCGACLLAIGLILFTIGDMHVHPKFNFFGVLLVLLALVCDAFLGNFQERLFRTYRASRAEVVAFTYSIGCCLLFIWMLTLRFDELCDGILFLWTHFGIFVSVLVASVLNYGGIVFVLSLLELSDAFTVVFVTSLRKVLTIILSFLIFAKPFSIYYAAGFVAVCGGIILDVRSQYAKTTQYSSNSTKLPF
jgi:adenosine 3'-phospho 5'-phosphosulfate transporter B3